MIRDYRLAIDSILSRVLRAWLPLVAVATLGCGADTTAATGGATGTWILQIANGKALPYLQVSTSGGGNLYLTNDTLVVTSGGTFTERGVRKTGTSPTSLVSYDTYAYTGAYTAVGNSLTFAFQGGLAGTGTLSGDQLNVVFSGAAYSYKRKSALASP